MRVAIVGGGLVGMFSAYHLARAGAEVVLLERYKTGAACSAGNAGWITPSISIPVPAPHLRTTSLRWLLLPDSPLYIKPSATLELAPWLWKFWKHCTPESFERGARALADLGHDIMDQFDQLEADGLLFEQQRSGLLMVFQSSTALDAQLELFASTRYGPVTRLSPDELAFKEPALKGNYSGALHVVPERHVRPEKLCAQISQRIRELGVEVREGVAVADFAFDGSRATGLETNSGSVTADAYLIATGAEAARLARRCGTKLPIQAGKGYSVTVDHPRTAIGTPIYFAETKLGIAPYQNALRVAGTMELSGINLRLDRRRMAAFRRTAEREIPGVFEGGEVHEWVGMRPLTPDGLPVLGRLPKTGNVYIASGHQMVGVKLAPSTGRVLADLIVSGSSDVDLLPFAPERFTR